MNPPSGPWPSARRSGVAVLIAVCLVAGAVAYALTAGTGAGTSAQAGTIATESPAAFRTAVIARMHAENLNFHWVACVRTPHRFEGVRVVRCNVDFGIDPHVEAYCSVLRGGRLLTSEQDPAIPCGPDKAGFSAPVVTFG